MDFAFLSITSIKNSQLIDEDTGLYSPSLWGLTQRMKQKIAQKHQKKVHTRSRSLASLRGAL